MKSHHLQNWEKKNLVEKGYPHAWKYDFCIYGKMPPQGKQNKMKKKNYEKNKSLI